ncbi:MAG: hypothetical protein ACRDVW_00930 [Acidimicrobiales bacterium]
MTTRSNGHGTGRPLRRRTIPIAICLGIMTLSTGAAVAGAASPGVKLSTSGPAGEGPYPYRYPGSGDVQVGSGKTVHGSTCRSGTPQFASPYAVPCVAKFTGSNGGATSNGVTGTTITLATRTFPTTANLQEAEAEARAAGVALPQVTEQVAEVFVKYFNKVYDLYGRHVVFKTYDTTADATTEALGQGEAQACADAAAISQQLHAFAEDGLLGGGSGPFSQCAAQDHLVELNGDGYYNEGTFQQYNPYIWSFSQDCTRISSNEAEVVATMLANKKAIYAGEPSLTSKTRKFGSYFPDVPAYIKCSKNFAKIVTTKYHLPLSDFVTYTYSPDIATFAQSAQQAIVQFKAAGVTTVLIGSDPYSAGLLTQAAQQQDFSPEWFLEGSALTDEDQAVQAYDVPSEVTGHLFGMSELSPPTETSGPDSLAGKLYKKLTGHTIPKGTDGDYGSLVYIFDALQSAGPDLTPQNLARGLHAIPALGAPAYQYGKWSWNIGPTGTAGAGDHSAGADDRFIWWNGNAISAINGEKGTYVAAFGGKRFSFGQWPTSLPAMFTKAG